MLLNVIVWTIMQNSRSWSAFTLDAFLTVINLIYKNLFFHQPFDGLSIIINAIKLFAKRNIRLGNNNNENKDMKYVNQILLDLNKDFSVNILTLRPSKLPTLCVSNCSTYAYHIH